jgi:hypothetical protein
MYSAIYLGHLFTPTPKAQRELIDLKIKSKLHFVRRAIVSKNYLVTKVIQSQYLDGIVRYFLLPWLIAGAISLNHFNQFVTQFANIIYGHKRTAGGIISYAYQPTNYLKTVCRLIEKFQANYPIERIDTITGQVSELILTTHHHLGAT